MWSPLDLVAGRRTASASGSRLAELTEDVGVDLERRTGREDDGTLEDVLQLADVARPGYAMSRRSVPGSIPSNRLPIRAGELVEEELHQERDVLGALAERRELDREDAEAVVEVLAERLLADGLEQVAVGRGDDPDVDLARRRAADPVELALLQDAQQLGLGLGGELADLVEEDRAAVGQLEPAGAAGDRAGEGPLLVAEQLALDESRGQGRAVDLDERLVPARLVEWMARAISSLPVPVSPQIRTVASVAATRRTLSSTAASAGLRPTISSKLWTDLISSWR